MRKLVLLTLILSGCSSGVTEVGTIVVVGPTATTCDPIKVSIDDKEVGTVSNGSTLTLPDISAGDRIVSIASQKNPIADRNPTYDCRSLVGSTLSNVGKCEFEVKHQLTHTITLESKDGGVTVTCP